MSADDDSTVSGGPEPVVSPDLQELLGAGREEYRARARLAAVLAAEEAAIDAAQAEEAARKRRTFRGVGGALLAAATVSLAAGALFLALRKPDPRGNAGYPVLKDYGDAGAGATGDGGTSRPPGTGKAQRYREPGR